MFKLYITAVFLLLNICRLFGQINFSTNDSLLSKMTIYSTLKSQSLLFAHFDKNVYVANENVWFTAYLLNFKENNNPTVLSSILIDAHKKSTILKQRFVMANGLSFGNFHIPDTIPPGNYNILLYTNVLINNMPVDYFVQRIVIKTASAPDLSISLSLKDSMPTATVANRHVLVKVENNDKQPVTGAEVIFHLGEDLFTPLQGSANTDKNGDYFLTVPADKIMPGANMLTANVIYKKENKMVQLVLPAIKKRLSVKFYPEGGSLIHATSSVVGWEVKGMDGEPVKIRGILLRDNNILDTIETDSYGIGKFKLIPLIGSRYEVKLLSIEKDSIFRLPPILKQGPVMSIYRAVTDDTLNVRLVSKFPGRYYLLVHNYKNSFFLIPVDVGAAGRKVAIYLKDVPRGLSEITILDSLQRPLAERIFFAHYDQNPKTTLLIDQARYTTRQKVNLRLQIASYDGNPTDAVFSVACVQSNRLELKNSTDIVSYFYLRNELGSLPIKDGYMGQDLEQKEFLENVLLVKGWRRYTWQELLQANARDTSGKIVNTLPFEATVTQYGRPLKKPKTIMVKTDSVTNIISTNKNGYFTLTGQNIINNEGRKIYLILPGLNSEYQINVVNSFGSTDNLMVKAPIIFNSNIPSYNAITDTMAIKENHVINLKEVKIFGKNDNQMYESSYLSYGEKENQCGDYVCRNNILNCQNHRNEPDNWAPIKGETYRNMAGGNVIYTGCVIIPTSSTLRVDGLSYSKEFYVSDYSRFNFAGPEYLSTIFWKHIVRVDSKGEVSLSFYTSDISGSFKIVVQGIAGHDVFYQEKEFEVVKKK